MAWVAALGREWGENAERGIFKTTDGGKSWRKVLYVDEKTGGKFAAAVDKAQDAARKAVGAPKQGEQGATEQNPNSPQGQ